MSLFPKKLEYPFKPWGVRTGS